MADVSTYLERSNRESTYVYLWSARHSMEERGGVSRAHQHLKQHGLDQRAENRADFDRVKMVFFTLPLRNFNQSML